MKSLPFAIVLAVIVSSASPGARQERRWMNPWLIVRPAGVDLYSPFASGHYLVPPASLKKILFALPKAAWPEGRVVKVEEMSYLRADDERLAANMSATLATLADLRIDAERRPRTPPTVQNAELIEREWLFGAGNRRLLIDDALAATEQAIAAGAKDQRTLVYHVRSLEMKARSTSNRTERGVLRRQAEQIWRRAVESRFAPAKPAPATAADLSAAIFGETFAETIRRLRAVPGGQHYPRPTSFWTTQPLYPQLPAETPVLRIVIGPDGVVMNAELIRGEAAIARAVLEASRLRFYTPPAIEGRGTVAWIETITFGTGR